MNSSRKADFRCVCLKIKPSNLREPLPQFGRQGLHATIKHDPDHPQAHNPRDAVPSPLAGLVVPRYTQAVNDWITVSQFFMEFIIGICMFIVVGFLLIFRHKEVKECAKVHLRIRFYFGLTFIATFSNLALGICGTIYVITDRIW